MFFCYQCHLLRSESKIGHYENPHQRYNEHDVVENKMQEGMDPQCGDAHDISNRGEIHLPGADHLSGRNGESKSERGYEARFRRPGLSSDNSMDLFLQDHGKLKLHFFDMTSTKLKIIIKTYYPKYERKHPDDEINPFRDHRKTAQLTQTSHEPHSGDDVSNKDTKGEHNTVGEDLFTLFA